MQSPLGGQPPTKSEQGGLPPMHPHAQGPPGGAGAQERPQRKSRIPGTSPDLQVDEYMFGKMSMQLEESEEQEVLSMMHRTQFPERPESASLSRPSLASGGRHDDLLLQLGASKQLFHLLPELFRNDPANDCGRRPRMAGLFHGHANRYAQDVFSPAAALTMFSLLPQWYENAPNIMRLMLPSQGRLIIVGDTHGQLEDVLWMFFKYGAPSKQNQYLFVGDIVDRGGHALDILLLLLALKRDDPQSVHITRGNHEDWSTSTTYGFKAELESKFGAEGAWFFHHLMHDILPLLPLGAVVSDTQRTRPIFVVHGGIPVGVLGFKGVVTIDGTLEGLNRRVPTTQDRVTVEENLLFHLLWADPAKAGAPKFDAKGRGNPFFEEDTIQFCQANGVSCVVRAHQPPEDHRGFFYHHQNRCITVFSASNYTGNHGNKGGVLMCDHRFATHGPQPEEHWAPSWPHLADVMRQFDIEATTPASRKLAAQSMELATLPSRPVDAAGMEELALTQVENRITDLIVSFKEQLLGAFTRLDKADTGMVAREAWAECMHDTLGDTFANAWEVLAERWKLGGQVKYVPFLHRFQITSEAGHRRHSVPADVFTAMAQLRVKLSDVEAHKLLASLDQNANGQVDLEEFTRFLVKNDVGIPQRQAAALYEAIVTGASGRAYVHDVLMAMALITVTPIASETSSGGAQKVAAWTSTARRLGEEITKQQSLVSFFDHADVDNDGYIDAGELRQALVAAVPNLASRFNQEQMNALAQHIDAQGVHNGRISLMEFLRAMGPARVAKLMQNALLGEALKPIYFHRTMLASFMAHYNPTGHTVSVEQFRQGVFEMNRQCQLSESAEYATAGLTPNQVEAVCEIASGGSDLVYYDEFLKSLRVVDKEKRKATVQSGMSAMRNALQGLGVSFL